jgi:hypothetical protein
MWFLGSVFCEICGFVDVMSSTEVEREKYCPLLTLRNAKAEKSH